MLEMPGRTGWETRVMNKLWLALLIFGLVSMPAFAQDEEEEEEYYDIRDVDIDSNEDEGALVQDALDSESADEKIELLESFVAQYPEHDLIDYVRLLLQSLHLEKENWAKSAEHGTSILEIAPDDLEVLHNLTKALEGAQDWAALLPHLLSTKSYAEKAARPGALRGFERRGNGDLEGPGRLRSRHRGLRRILAVHLELQADRRRDQAQVPRHLARTIPERQIRAASVRSDCRGCPPSRRHGQDGPSYEGPRSRTTTPTSSTSTRWPS